MELFKDEEIRDIINYEGLYAATSFGRIWAYSKSWKVRNGGNHVRIGRWLKPKITNRGYNEISLCKNNIHISYRKCKIIANLYVTNPNSYDCVNHIDGCKTNDNYLNLEHCSNQMNTNHALLTGLKKKEKSVYFGVSPQIIGNHTGYKVRCYFGGKLNYIGYFKCEIAAAKAWNQYLLDNNITDKLFNTFQDVRNIPAFESAIKA